MGKYPKPDYSFHHIGNSPSIIAFRKSRRILYQPHKCMTNIEAFLLNYTSPAQNNRRIQVRSKRKR